MGKTQEVEGLRLAGPALFAVRRRKAAELDQAGLVRVQLQREFLKPRAHRIEEPVCIGLVFEAHDQIAGGNGQRPLLSIRLRYVRPAGRLRTVRSPLAPSMQLFEPWL